jgi:hypothetical protein
MADIFISYSRQDMAFVNELTSQPQLYARGVAATLR